MQAKAQPRSDDPRSSSRCPYIQSLVPPPSYPQSNSSCSCTFLHHCHSSSTQRHQSSSPDYHHHTQQHSSNVTLLDSEVHNPSRSSEDTLVSNTTETTLVEHHLKQPIMPEEQNVVRERRISYGIGGAGNMRRPSELKKLSEVTSIATTGNVSNRSDSTATSSDGRKSSLFNFFRRSSKTGDVVAPSIPSVIREEEAVQEDD